ncbi:MAG: NAD(P)/FAD-dependent oxidoreductase, partial [Clostridia bacterium]|nr:NAD(P)/FAD-dependent oxidoreductase [Clostridia bacterium]
MKKVIVVGAGVSGLSAGIYARLAGFDVTVCERHRVPGGNLTGWQRGEYHIDNCLHWLTGTNPSSEHYKMWEDLGVLGDVGIYQSETLFTCEYGGRTLSLSNDLEKFKSDMLDLSPEDKKEINSLVNAIRLVSFLQGIGGKEHNKKSNVFTLAASVPSLVKYYKLTTGELAKRFHHPLLQRFIASFFTENFGSLAMIYVFSNFCSGNAGIPVGSSCALANRMTEKFKRLGGELLLGREIKEINRDGDAAVSVTFADGETMNADYIIITAEPAVAFPKLLGMPLPKYFAKQYAQQRLIRFSSYQCAIACDAGTLPFKGDLTFELPPKYRRGLLTKYLILREFSHESDFAPEGKNIIQTMVYCSERSAVNFIKLREKHREAYEKRKKRMADMTVSAISEEFPELSGKLRCIDVWTPATYKRYVDSETGSFMGFAFSSKVVPQKLKNAVSGLKNVFMASQWLKAPGGLPIAAESGREAVKRILSREKRK